MKTEKELFLMLQRRGERLEGKVHILKSVEGDTYEHNERELESYRVYHSDGYCFDSKLEIEITEDDKKIYHYSFFSQWDGFKKLDVKSALEIMNRSIHRKLLAP